MKIRGIEVGFLVGAAALYVRRRVVPSDGHLRGLLKPAPGHRSTAEQRREARAADAMLRRLGVRCLWRAAIVTEILRREGVAAQITLSVSIRDPRRAHAECEVDGETLGSAGEDMVTLR